MLINQQAAFLHDETTVDRSPGRRLPTLWRTLVRRVRPFQHTIRGFVYDARRYMRHSGTLRRGSTDAIVNAAITKSYHTIEKGLALPQPKPGFGADRIKALCGEIDRAIRAGNIGDETRHAIDAIAGYRDFNSGHDIEGAPWIEATLALAEANGIARAGAPTKVPSAPAIASPAECLAFVGSRHSVRQFSDAAVPDEVLEKATRAAQAAPCVCNRQASNVLFIRDTDLKHKVLACQEGNRGFGGTAPVIAIVKVDLRFFQRPGERNQAWIDGGLFAMNLMLGFHAQRHGTCPLNWSTLPDQDRRLRSLGVVAEHENVIMMMAIGALPENLIVARSERRPLGSVMAIR